MRRYALLLALTLAPVLPAQEKISQVRQDLLEPFVEASGECLALAKAIPEDKFKWRPMEGVRSFGEVFAHMAGSTLLFCSYAGVKPPAGAAHDLAVIYMKRGFEMPEIFAAERAVKTKAQTIRKLPDSDHSGAADSPGRASRRAFGLVDRLRARQPHRAAVVAAAEEVTTWRTHSCVPCRHSPETLAQIVDYDVAQALVPAATALLRSPGAGFWRQRGSRRDRQLLLPTPHYGLYAMQSISTFSPGIANWHATVVRAGLCSPKNSA